MQTQNLCGTKASFAVLTTIALTLVSGSLCQQTSFAQTENAASTTASKQADPSNTICIDTLLKKRADLSNEIFNRYWTNVQVPLATSALGFDEYTTHRFGTLQPNLFPNLTGIRYTLPEAEQFSGTAEVTFNAAPRMQALFQNPVTPLILEDEHNVFSQTKPIVSLPGNSFLLKNSLSTSADGGATIHPTYRVYFQKADSISLADFHQFLKESLAPVFVVSDQVVKVNLHFIEVYQDNVWPSPGVDHKWDKEKQYQASLEIVFTNSAAAKSVFSSPAYKATEAAQSHQIKAVHAYPVIESDTFIKDSKPTLAGMRGATIAGVIQSVNAKNQLRPDVLKQTVNEKLIQP